MKRKIGISIATLLFAATITDSGSAMANSEQIRIEIDNKPVTFSNSVIIQNDITLVPLRGVFESLNAEVKWLKEENKIVASKDSTTIELKVGSNIAFKNYDSIKLIQEPKLVNGVTMVPLRFISESLGAVVSWDKKENLIIISSSNEKPINVDTNAEKTSAENTNVLTYQVVLETALKNSVDLKTANANVERSEEVKGKAQSNVIYLPTYVKQAFAALQQAEVGYQSAQKQIEITKDSIAYTVKKAYNGVQQAQNKVNVSTSSVKYAQTQEKIKELKYKEGLLSDYELQQAKIGSKEAIEKLNAANQSLDEAYEKLNILVGYEGKKRYNLVDQPKFELSNIEDLELHINRIIQDSTAVWLAEKKIDIAKLNLEQYVFNNPANPDTYHAKEIDIEKEQLALVDTKQQLEEATRNIYHNIKKLEGQYTILESQLKTAEENLRLSKAKYDTGTGVLSDLEAAQLQVDQYKQQMFDMVAQLDYLKLAYQKPWIAGQM